MSFTLIEKQFVSPVAGVDEAGRGPWAGPVVAAAVILDLNNIPDGINDSKKLSKPAREQLFHTIVASAKVGIGVCEAGEIDALNILGATKKAMHMAVSHLSVMPKMVLVDGNQLPRWEYESKAIIGGDASCLSIAAASIIAKVTRDRIMEKLAIDFPYYGWQTNVGYGTKAHQDGIAIHGICSQHRKSYAPIRAAIERMQVAA
jgi:ribonuclease HII